MEIRQPLSSISSIQPIQAAINGAVAPSPEPAPPPETTSTSGLTLNAKGKAHPSEVKTLAFNTSSDLLSALKVAKELSSLAQQGNSWQNLSQSTQAKNLMTQLEKLNKDDLHRVSCQMPEVFSQFADKVSGEKRQVLLTGVYEGLARPQNGMKSESTASLRQSVLQKLSAVGMTTTQAHCTAGSAYPEGVKIPQGLGWKPEMTPDAMTAGVIKNLTDSVKCNPMKFLGKYPDLTKGFAGVLMQNPDKAKEFLTQLKNLSPDLAKQVIAGLLDKVPDAKAALITALSTANPEQMKTLGFEAKTNPSGGLEHNNTPPTPAPVPVEPPKPPQPEKKFKLDDIIPKPNDPENNVIAIEKTVKKIEFPAGRSMDNRVVKIMSWIHVFLGNREKNSLMTQTASNYLRKHLDELGQSREEVDKIIASLQGVRDIRDLDRFNTYNPKIRKVILQACQLYFQSQ